MVSPMFMGGISITASNLTAGRTETEIVGYMCVIPCRVTAAAPCKAILLFLTRMK